MSYKDLRVLTFMLSRRENYREKMFSDHEVFCGPDWKTLKTPNGFKVIQTPVGILDIQEIIKHLPEHQHPDLLIVKTNSSHRNIPVNLSSLDCPKVLVLDKTHCSSPAIRSLAIYAKQEQFDYICSEENRQHLHFFRDLGFKNVFWTPGLNIKPFKQAFRLSRKKEIVVAPPFYPDQKFPSHLVHSLTNDEMPVRILNKSPQEAADLYNRSEICLNFSTNGNINSEFFEVLSSGGFLLSDKLSSESGINDILEEGVHFKEYSSSKELLELSRYYLEHSMEAQAIARAGLEAYEKNLSPEIVVNNLFKYVFEDSLDEKYKIESRTGNSISFSENGLKRISRYEWVQSLQFNSVDTSISVSPKVKRRLFEDIKDLHRVKIHSLKDHAVVDKLILEVRDLPSIDLKEQFQLQPFIELKLFSHSEKIDESIIRQLRKVGLKRDPKQENCFIWKSVFDTASLLADDLFEELMNRLNDNYEYGEIPYLELLKRGINVNKYSSGLLKNNRACLKALETAKEHEDLRLINSPLQLKTDLCQSPLKILLVTNLFPPQEFGGYGRLMADFSKVLQKRGHQVYVLTSNSPQFGAVPNVEPGVFRSLNLFGGWKDGQTFTLPESRSKAIKAKNLNTLQSHIQAFSPDVCLLGNIDCLGTELLFELLQKSIPVVHHLGGAWPGYTPDMQPESPLYVRACASQWVEDAIREKKYPDCNSCVVYPGAVTDFFNFKQKPHFDKLRIAFAGIVLPYKGPHLLVNSLAALNRQGIDFTCEIAGTTTDEKYLNQLKEFIESQKLSHKVRFCGFLNRLGMRELFARSNTLVFPTVVNEAFGISQVEAMASGLAVVSSGTGGACEVIQDGKNGFLFDPEDNDSLTEVLLKISRDKAFAKQMSLNAYRDALEKFNIVESVKILETKFIEVQKLSELHLLK